MQLHRFFSLFLILLSSHAFSQLQWQRMDNLFQGLPPGIEVYQTVSSLNGRPHIAWYVTAPLDAPGLDFITDTTFGRRLTPQGFFDKNARPAIVVNGTFFSFSDSKNLNLVIDRGRLLSHNIHSIPARGKDTGTYYQVSRAAIGIRKNGTADAAWVLTDTGRRHPVAFESAPYVDTSLQPRIPLRGILRAWKQSQQGGDRKQYVKRWKVETAIGGGPMLVQDGRKTVTNNEERMFSGKAVDDLHPRTAIGYSRGGRLIILVVQGRFPGQAEGASLNELADMLVELGAWEALNLDGGGSSCLLVQGKETIKPSDKTGQRAVPAVFMIREKTVGNR